MPTEKFEEKLDDLINEELTFHGNTLAAIDGVISVLELQLMALKEQEHELKGELSK